MKNSKKILSSLELKQFWDSFSSSYNKSSEVLHSLFMPMTQVSLTKPASEYKNILELAIGSGRGIKHLYVTFPNTETKIYGTDISTKMLEASKLNLETVNIKNYFMKSETDVYENVNKHTRVFLSEQDNEDLSLFREKYFDLILSNNSLHLVADPAKMLRECGRVLSDGGVACFSIWGRPENSFAFTLVPNVLKSMKISLPNARTNFHISNEKLLRNLVLENGFNKVNICHTYIPFRIFKPEDFYYMLDAPIYSEILEKMDNNTKKEFYNELNKEIYNKLDSGDFIGSEFFIVRCEKY
jgi:ubiquinone/menaquinone biosynthesis C-methylase UbiE